jgi:hypothetical protein
MDGFADLLCSLLARAGVRSEDIYRRTKVEIPGYYRAEKKWDLVIVSQGKLLACVEFKAQVGPSFGNNFNNRTEEALGAALDFWTAYREGAFPVFPRPWLGYLLLLEDAEGSRASVGAAEPHFPVFPEFREASYAKRYQILLQKLVRERLYDGAALLLSPAEGGKRGVFSEPDPDLSFGHFASALLAHATRELG